MKIELVEHDPIVAIRLLKGITSYQNNLEKVEYSLWYQIKHQTYPILLFTVA